jgi:fumarate reductase flavoprotein subunit
MLDVRYENLDKFQATNNISFKTQNSKFIILTTGGYGSNHEFFKKVTPSDWTRLVSTAQETSTGDGIIAAMAVGAKFHNADKHTATLGGLELEPNSGRTDFWKNWARVSNSIDRKPREIYVNAHARRFMDENEPDPDTREKAVEAQPDKKMWLIFDEKALYDEGGCIVPQWAPEKLKQEAQNQKAVWVADTIEQLAIQIGLDEATLTNTVNDFNDCVVNQNDINFGRTHLQNAISEGPFYAILTYCFSLVTFGGLATNADLQVLDTDNRPMPNLYAAGEILGGGVTCGNAFVGGMFVTPALSFGRYLGQKLAQIK